MLEQIIQKKIIKALEDEGAFVFKTVTTNTNGIPDLICCYNGKYIAIEVKQPKKKPTAIQIAQMEQIEKAGGIVGIVTNTDEALTLLRRIK